MRRTACVSLLIGAAAAAVGCIGVSAPRPANAGAPIKKCPGTPVGAADGMIDDFEDGNTAITAQQGRSGYWFKSADSGGSFFGPDDIGPVAGAGPKGTFALHPLGQTVAGSGEGIWGAILGATLNSEKAYDASKYVGVSFWAKIGKKSTRSIRFEIADGNTHPNGGICSTGCWNHFGKNMTFTTEWKEYVIPFRALSQEEGWGDPRPANIDPSKLISIGWKIKPGSPFEFWLDDLQFLGCE